MASVDEQLMRDAFSYGSQTYLEVMAFLIEEAAILDEDRFDEWLALMAPDVGYRMPVRRTLLRKDGLGHETESFYFEEDATSLAVRVSRLTSTNAWAEDPPSRVRRFVSNVRVRDGGSETLGVSSYLLVLRSRWSNSAYDILTAERRDVLRRVDGRLLLADRTIAVDQAVLGTPNLAIFL
jgi:3-phenylpropionate/cinnamic acid dioxygenase small subunit